MLDDDNGRAVIEQRLKNAEQHPHVERVQTDGRFVEHENGIRLRFADLAGQLQPLRLAAGETGRFLAQREIAKTQLPEDSQLLADGFSVFAKFHGAVHVHVHELRQRSARPRLVRELYIVGLAGIP